MAKTFDNYISNFVDYNRSNICQLTETLTNDKYRSSMEKVGKYIAKYSSRPGFDVITFFETAIFSFLTGNADMHLKNFSLLTKNNNDIILPPAYDLLSTKIAMPEDKDEMALTINARKRKLRKSDFDTFAKNLKIPEKAMENSYKKFADKIHEAKEWIGNSFLPKKMKAEYNRIIDEKGIDALANSSAN